MSLAQSSLLPLQVLDLKQMSVLFPFVTLDNRVMLIVYLLSFRFL
jgi:hypothetical protein